MMLLRLLGHEVPAQGTQSPKPPTRGFWDKIPQGFGCLEMCLELGQSEQSLDIPRPMRVDQAASNITQVLVELMPADWSVE